MDTIGTRIQTARKIQGYTIDQLHKLSGLSVKELNNFEEDQWTPPISALIALQRPLRCTMEWLLCREHADTPLTPVEADLLTKFRFLNKHDKKILFDITSMLYGQAEGNIESQYKSYNYRD